MHSVGFLLNMPKNKNKQSNEEKAVSDYVKELETSLQLAKDHADNLEKEFDKYTQGMYSQTCAKKEKGCEPDKTDKKSVTDAQSSTQGWVSWAFSWAFSWVRHQKTEPDGDQISEEKMWSSLQKNKKLIECCQEKFKYLSEEKQNQDLHNKHSEWKNMRVIKWISKNIFFQQPEKQNVTLQLYCQQQADIIPSIMTELKKMLRSDCSSYSIELKGKILESAREINTDFPLMVICLHASRLDPDISEAIRGIKSGPSVAVVIVHHKDIFALPTERSDEILLEEEYREIGAIIDVAFMAGKGMYKCDMNNIAIKEIIKFIERNGIKNIKQ